MVFAGALALLGALILFLPLSWNIALPGEVVPAERQLVTVREGGYLVAPLKRLPRPVEPGDLLFTLSSPQLVSGIERMRSTLDYDRTLQALQQVDEKQFSAALITEQKIRSDQLNLIELLRRRNDLRHSAGNDGIFVSHLPDLSAGAFLPKGQTVGEIVSGRRSVYAYATDREVGKLNMGDSATIRVGGELTTYQAKIVSVNPLAARLKNSPLLQHFGGPIPVYIEEGKSESYSSVLPLYRVELTFDSTVEAPLLDSGRVVTVRIHHTEQLYPRILRFLLSAFRKEF